MVVKSKNEVITEITERQLWNICVNRLELIKSAEQYLGLPPSKNTPSDAQDRDFFTQKILTDLG
jgi:hypothetical protein